MNSSQMILDTCSNCGSIENLRRIKRQIFTLNYELNAEQLIQVKKSITEVGFLKPLILGNSTKIDSQELIVCQTCLDKDKEKGN